MERAVVTSGTEIPPGALIAAPMSPFVGLEPYREGDAAYFFGREPERRIIAANLRSSRLTLLYGASGVGKSSVLRAGVLHQLRLKIVRDAQQPRDPDERAALAATYFGAWREPDPLQVLLERIQRAVAEALGGDPVEQPSPTDDVVATLRDFNRHVRSILVILDQFEEYFLYHPQESGPGTWNDEFPRIVNDPTLRVNFLVSIREDAWARLDHFKPTIPDLFSNYLRLEYLDREAAAEAITGPVQAFNTQCRIEPPYSVEPELVDAVVDGAQAQAALLSASADSDATRPQSHIEPPFLQLVMERLWEATTAAGARALTIRTLDDLGGAQKIVRRHVEEAMLALEGPRRDAAASLFRFLITSSKTKIAQRASDLAAWTDLPEADVIDVLQQLAGTGSARILRPLPPAPGERSPRYEIFHDVLAEPLVEWRGRYQAEQDAVALEQRLEDEKRERLEAERRRHEKQVNRIVRGSVVGLGVLAVALFAAVLWALHERSVARSRALAATAVAQLDDDPQLSIMLAREALRKEHTPEAERALREALGASHAGWSKPLKHAVGKVLTGAGPTLVTISGDAAQRWTLADPPRMAGPALRDVDMAALSANGRGLAVGGKGGVWTEIGGHPPTELESEPVKALAVSSDAAYVATASESEITIFNRATGRREASLPGGGKDVDLAFSPRDRGLLVVVTCDPTRARLWHWRTERPVVLRDDSVDTDPCAVSFSPEGTRFVTAIGTKQATLWNAESGERIAKLTSLEQKSPAGELMAWSEDETRLAIGAGYYTSIFDGRTGEPITYSVREDDVVTSVALNPAGTLMATGLQNGSATVSDARTGIPLARLRGHIDTINSVRFLGPETLVTGSDDRTLKQWDVSTGRHLGPPRTDVVGAAFDTTGRRVVSTGKDGTFVVPVRGGEPKPIESEELDERTSVAFTATGDWVVIGGSIKNGSGAVLVADSRTGRPLAPAL
jgi:hypothetical protein